MYREFRIEDRAYLYRMEEVTISCVLEPTIEVNPYYFLYIVIIIGALKGKFKKKG